MPTRSPAFPSATAVVIAAALLLVACGGRATSTNHRPAAKGASGRAWRVAILGDSIENEVAPRLTAELKASGVAEVFSRTFSGESFCSAWANHGQRVADFKPDLLLIEGEGLAFSACSKQAPYPADPMNQDAWQAAFSTDLRDAIYELRQGGPVQVILDAGPVAKPVRPYQERSRDTYRALAKRYPSFVTALNAQATVLGPKGQYVDELPCTKTEVKRGRCAHAPGASKGMIRVRAYDHRHFCLTPSRAAWPAPGCSTYSSGIERYAKAQAEAVLAHLHR